MLWNEGESVHQRTFVCCLLFFQKHRRPGLQLVYIRLCRLQHWYLSVDMIQDHLNCCVLVNPLLRIITGFKPCEWGQHIFPTPKENCSYRRRKRWTLEDGITFLAESWFIFKLVPKETKFPQSCSLSLRLSVLPKQLSHKLGSFKHILCSRKGNSYETPTHFVKLAVKRAWN